MKRILYPLVLALLCALASARAADGLPERFDPARDAAADVARAVALAQAQGKRVLVDVGGQWCPWCHVLDRFFDTHTQVKALREEAYVWVKVNWSPANRNERLLSQWPKIKSYPHLFVLDAYGALVHSQASAELESGKDYDPQRMTAFLARYRGP